MLLYLLRDAGEFESIFTKEKEKNLNAISEGFVRKKNEEILGDDEAKIFSCLF